MTTNRRVPGNPNLKIWPEKAFDGLPVNPNHQMVQQYLVSLKRAIDLSIQDYPRVFAVILQLQCPYPIEDLSFSNQVMGRFKDALVAKVRAYQQRLEKRDAFIRPCRVRMAWGREQGISRSPHFHVLLLFNSEVFGSLGKFNSRKGSLYQMIQGAWCSALKVPLQHGGGLVHVPENATYYLNESDGHQKLPALFMRASYLCKVETKRYGQRLQNFGSSRR